MTAAMFQAQGKKVSAGSDAVDSPLGCNSDVKLHFGRTGLHHPQDLNFSSCLPLRPHPTDLELTLEPKHHKAGYSVAGIEGPVLLPPGPLPCFDQEGSLYSHVGFRPS